MHESDAYLAILDEGPEKGIRDVILVLGVRSPIPLAPPDADLTLALQPLVEAVYARSHYDRDIDYRQPLTPPLAPAEAQWLEERLRQ